MLTREGAGEIYPYVKYLFVGPLDAVKIRKRNNLKGKYDGVREREELSGELLERVRLFPSCIFLFFPNFWDCFSCIFLRLTLNSFTVHVTTEGYVFLRLPLSRIMFPL